MSPGPVFLCCRGFSSSARTSAALNLAFFSSCGLMGPGCGAALDGEALCGVPLRFENMCLVVFPLVVTWIHVSVAAARAMGPVRYPLVRGAAEQFPFAADSFDLVFCDFGGLSWAPPHLAVPQAARVLGRGGRLCSTSPAHGSKSAMTKPPAA